MIAVASYLGKPPIVEEKKPAAKPVTVYSIGTSARTLAQGKVEKTGLLTITAQTNGIVNKIGKIEGQEIKQGTSLITLATNYSGANVPAQQAMIAAKQFQFQEETRELQKSLIVKQRSIAEKTAENSDELRKISEQSLQSINEQISLNGEILSSIDTSIKNLEDTNVDGSNDQLINSTKQLKSQFLAARSQLESAKRSTEYQVNTNKPPTQLTNLTKDITMQQLDLQEKSLELNYELARINRTVAAISASLMNPTAPFSGKVERVYVKPGQAVTPGMPLVTLSGQQEGAKIVVPLSSALAQRVTALDSPTLILNNQEFPLTITHKTSEALDDGLVDVILSVPDEALSVLSNNLYATVSLPVGYPQSSSAIPIIPIDTVHQTQQGAYVFLVKDGVATSHEITLGEILGDSVEVREGLTTGDALIIDRSITTGEPVRIE